MSLIINSIKPAASTEPLSLNRCAKMLDIGVEVLKKGLEGGTIPDQSLATIAALAQLEIITEVEVDGAPVPVLRPGVLLKDPRDPRRYFGWGIDRSTADTTIALDRWWPQAGRERVIAAGGYLVAVGSVICGGLELRSNEITFGTGFAVERIAYDAQLAGVLRSGGRREILAAGTWGEIMDRTLGKRLLGGKGGNFTTIQPAEPRPADLA